MPIQPLIVFDDNGVTVPTKSQIFQYLVNLKKEIYGQDIIIQEGTPEYAEIDFMADHFTEVNNSLKTLYDAMSPQTASSVMLDNIIALSGIVRIAEIRSTADVLISGTGGLTILNGVVKDVNDNLWDLPASVTIGAGGTVTVTVTAQTSGAISALPSTIIIIQTETVGWDSVTNSSPASIGSSVEADSQLRTRRTLSTGISAITPVDSLTAHLLQIENVSDVLIFENDTVSPFTLKGGSSPGDDIPAHSIAPVVEGGDQDEIAEAIRLKKTLGCGTFGDTSIILTDVIGQESTYNFERPANESIYVAITIVTTGNYADTTDDLINQALVDIINDSNIAVDITVGSLLNAVYVVDPLSDGLRTFNITVLDFGTSVSPTTNTTVVIAWNKTSYTDEDFSKIVLTKT